MNAIYFLLGLLVLFLNKIRYSIFGYSKPRDFLSSEISRAVDYDRQVVDNWRYYLKKYSGTSDLEGKRVLELGPGADLGVGLILLSKGVAEYKALDVNDLASRASEAFYINLFETMGGKQDMLMSQLEKFRSGRPDRLDHVVDKRFDPGIFSDMDIVFSQAAFEHFQDMPKVIKGISRAVKKGGILVAEIDLATHTGFLSGRDPLNIYRYPKFLYDIFKFSGIPNRLRPGDYERLLKDNGWKDIKIYPLKTLSDEEFVRVKGALARRFKNDEQKMTYLSIMICAKKK